MFLSFFLQDLLSWVWLAFWLNVFSNFSEDIDSSLKLMFSCVSLILISVFHGSSSSVYWYLRECHGTCGKLGVCVRLADLPWPKVGVSQPQHHWYFGLDNYLLWNYPMHCRLFSSIPGFFPLDAYSSSTAVMAIKDLSRHCQMLPWGNITPHSLNWEPLL